MHVQPKNTLTIRTIKMQYAVFCSLVCVYSTKEIIESSYMQRACERLLRFIITNILTMNSLAGLESTRTHAIRGRKITLGRLHISLSVGIIITLLHMTLPPKPLTTLISVNKLQKRHKIPSNRLGFLTTEPKWTA